MKIIQTIPNMYGHNKLKVNANCILLGKKYDVDDISAYQMESIIEWIRYLLRKQKLSSNTHDGFLQINEKSLLHLIVAHEESKKCKYLKTLGYEEYAL